MSDGETIECVRVVARGLVRGSAWQGLEVDELVNEALVHILPAARRGSPKVTVQRSARTYIIRYICGERRHQYLRRGYGVGYIVELTREEDY